MVSGPPRVASEWDAITLGELIKEIICAGEQIRHCAFRARDLVHHLTGIRRDLLVQVQFIIRGADERFGEVYRVVNDLDYRKPVSVPDPVFG